MTRTSLALMPFALVVAACGSEAAPSAKPSAPVAKAAARPVVVELFQSQGCSSCPPANANLNAIADRADLIPLSFAVTYWDQLGWKDTFARRQYTQRQWDYAHAGGRGNVGTPQMVINGRDTLVGGNRAELNAKIRAAKARPGGPAIKAADGRVAVGTGGKGTADVWLVRYDPRTLNIAIRAGENGGRTLPHRNIVKSLQRLGGWNGVPVNFALPTPVAGLRSAVLVQRANGGPILAAQRI